MDAEDLNRRRQQRKLRAQQRKKKRQRFFLILGGAALIVSLAILLLVLLLSGKDKPAAPETTGTTAPTTPDTVIHVAAAGDLNVTDNIVAAGGGTFDYSGLFLDVAHVLADADISVLNFEGSLVGEPYGSASRSAPLTLMDTLDDAGVDLIQLANSFSIKNGMSGLTQTIDGVRAAGMEPLGVYASGTDYDREGGYTLVTAQGIRVAFLAFTKGMDGMTLPPGSEDCVNVLYTDYDSTYQKVDTEKIDQVLNRVRQADPDITVVLLHWGSEYNDTISASQKEITKLLQNRGVDAIIGTHSHYVQKIDFDPQKGQLVAYSLGDFLGDAQRSGSEYSIILDLEITKDADSGKVALTGYSYTPIYSVTEKDTPPRVVRLLRAIQAYEDGYLNRVSPSLYESMIYARKRIIARTWEE